MTLVSIFCWTQWWNPKTHYTMYTIDITQKSRIRQFLNLSFKNAQVKCLQSFWMTLTVLKTGGKTIENSQKPKQIQLFLTIKHIHSFLLVRIFFYMLPYIPNWSDSTWQLLTNQKKKLHTKWPHTDPWPLPPPPGGDIDC